MNQQTIIMTAVTGLYADYLGAFVSSLRASLHARKPVDLWVIYEGLSLHQRTLFQKLGGARVRMTWVSADVLISRVFGSASSLVRHATYFRLLAPYATHESRILHCDADIVFRDDPRKLFSTNLRGGVLGAALDSLPTVKLAVPNWKQLGLCPDAPYFNSGVMLIDAPRWRSLNISERVVTICDRNRSHLVAQGKWPQNDQYGLNVAVAGNWRRLPQSWNVGSHFSHPRPHLVHYYGDGKPRGQICLPRYRDWYFSHVENWTTLCGNKGGTGQLVVDIVVCASLEDVSRLLVAAINACARNFPLAGSFTVVTPSIVKAKAQLARVSVAFEVPVRFIEDADVIPHGSLRAPGWIRQQLIKLRADTLSRGRFIACLGADTLFLKATQLGDWFSGGRPILYYNTYPHTQAHTDYERVRLTNVANLLGISPARSRRYVDFIMDFMIFDRAVLRRIREHMRIKHGRNWEQTCLPSVCETLEDKQAFGEWTLYAVFLLDVLRLKVVCRNSRNRFIAQLHSERGIRRLNLSDISVLHVVPKKMESIRGRKFLASVTRP